MLKFTSSWMVDGDFLGKHGHVNHQKLWFLPDKMLDQPVPYWHLPTTPKVPRLWASWIFMVDNSGNSEVGPTGNVVWFGDLKSWSCSEQQMGGKKTNIPYNWEAFVFTFGSFLGFFWAGIHSSIFYGLGLGSMNVFRPIIEILRHIVSLTLVQGKIYIPVGCFHAWKFRTLEPSAVES